ncbi:FHA domain-containing protein [Paenibacillus lycopersici]|uniref:FHA domain-containing protein n=1 Tax=Paenibacillus lycopersici TaxID=2704462 RepID=A0A6C0G5D6_9BACL|nr:DUF6382 domain-containing protein [Paenibacillus lycopersici]QHT62784.1 FHA domain-containing protein [Paenibacillus lycopersici]
MILDELRVDFAMKRGHEMIVDLQSGLTRDQLDGIEIQMLQGQRIPKLLPVEWIDIDGSITFRYPLQGKRMLMHRLQTQRMTMLDFYSLLLSVAEALDDCRHYMLRPDCFLLHEQYVFIGDNWDDAALAYVPLRNKGVVASAGEAVLAMAIRWVGDIDEPDGIGLQQVFQHLRGEHVSWEQLRVTLLALLGASQSAAAEGVAPIGDMAMGETAVSRPPLQARQPLQTDQPLQQPGRAPIQRGQMQAERSAIIHEYMPAEPAWNRSNPTVEERERAEPAEAVDLPLTEISEQAGPSRAGWMIGAGWVLAAAVLWRFLYLAAPTRQNMLLSAAGTLMIGAIGWIVFRRIKDRDWESEEEEEVQDEAIDRWKGGKAWAIDDDFVPNSDALGRRAAVPAAGMADGSASAKWSQHRQRSLQEEEPGGTDSGEMLFKPLVSKAATSNDATVLLGQEAQASAENKRPLPWLERNTDGQTEKIRLERQHFVIGRSNEGVHYIDASSGISRAHLELAGQNGHWSAKDMGSRNGSTLNGNAMVPYKAYTLADTDKLQLAGDEGPVYIFRASAAGR